ncbi:MAG: malto-oligosyltrehalose synthase [Actinomycetaceae bacterium]|nr:malto-oligosyltrehalose synthase [Actinomycetaceae bacterium]
MTSAVEYPHFPEEPHHIPLTTYRLQLNADFTFYDAHNILPYLDDLGITDIYLSPILQAVPGSTHGYDVVDHSHISAELGGREAFIELSQAAHRRGMGVIVDVVPNHMAIPTPVWHNRPLWSLLKRGSESAYANWFDVELDSPIMMPILGKRIGQALADQDLTLTQMVIPTEPERGQQWVLTYYEHVFPVAEGTESLPLSVLVERQNYRLAHWKVADEELNYRRFFDVGTLAAIRVEEPEVFQATHQVLLDLYRQGMIDGFRVDHPDGLANPREYFHHLSQATNGAWIVGEKILEGEETLPTDWPIAGTTGYDTAWRLTSLQVNSAAALPLGALMHHISGDSPSAFPQVVRDAKEQIIDTSLAAEIRRLGQLIWNICQDDLRLRDYTFRGLIDCLRLMTIHMDRYRAYIVPGETAPSLSRTIIEETARRAKNDLDPDLYDTLDVICRLVLGDEVGSAGLNATDKRREEVIIRFQQVCGAVMAKGVEDTAFYRWTHLTCLNEVGGSPNTFGIVPDDMHRFAAQLQSTWPATMTCGTTHDTKRCEDVRARIAVMSHYPDQWLSTVHQMRSITATIRPSFDCGAAENLLYQTLAGTWSRSAGDELSDDRLVEYLRKSVREQKTWTQWTAVDDNAERQFFDFALAVKNMEQIHDILNNWADLTEDAVRATLLSTKVLQMTLPGVADIYQGEELTRTSLVDPDNRRSVDFDHRHSLLSGLQRASTPHGLNEEKLHITSKICQVRQRHRDVFVSGHTTYEALPTSSSYVYGFTRSTTPDRPQIAVVASRLYGMIDKQGGWSHEEVVLPQGRWHDALTRSQYHGGSILVATLFSRFPAAVLENTATESVNEAH